ncbi:MAG: FtsH protease activity modulator HflK [Deltaproteobacteria bacterium]
MASNGGGPWGGGDDDDDKPRGGRNEGTPNWAREGQERLKVLMGGRGNRGGSNGTGGGTPEFPTSLALMGGVVVAVLLWAFASFYTVKPEEKSVELFLGKFSGIGTEGLNFAPWPFVTAIVLPVTRQQIEDIGLATSGQSEAGLMLTTDENIVDIDFQVVWNISDPAKYLFNLADPKLTIQAVSESAMREIVASSQLAPILNRDRARIQAEAQALIQQTLDAYDSGVFVVQINLNKVDPPLEVIDAFRDVQAAEQERDRLQREADAYANRVLAGARGQAASLVEQAEGYRAQVVNEAEGEASRFLAVLAEYKNAPEVTRKRLYLETMETVFSQVDKIILDDNVGGEGGQGVVPFLPLNELRRPPAGGN